MYKVILVDDEVWVINGLMQKVCWNDYMMQVVGTATDGLEAVKLATELKPNLVITDVRMPGLDGLALIRQLQAVDSNIICIILTGYDYFDYTQKALRLGVFDYLLKPIDPDNIEDVLIRASIKLSELTDEKIGTSIPILLKEKHQNAKVAKVIEYIDDYYQKDLSLSEIAGMFDTNPSYLSDIFGRTTGQSFSQYLCTVRIDKAKQLLRYTNYTVETVSTRTGFSNYQHFVRSFKRVTGTTPSHYRSECREEIQ
jgi:two-component system response regulator YesN